ncbi:putative chromatin remodelling complex ATPase chain [Leucosporidium creatinivorum]|uniref:Putative chromatin remodelling complex ATPase chain n=1 Tax=Leucosporidium creatinivorum TaxID=106004 RepID=A0A1Y2FYL9_9BASI|nr:putative chromatin remodelling complex ATPase chain [Leucosporidium creatinivorum]
MASTSGAFAPNPQLSLPGDDADKLSDYIPGSNEVSRVPSAVPSASEDESEEEEEDEEEEGADQDGDVQMAGDSPKKTPGVLRKEMAAKERTKKKKEAKRDMDDKLETRRKAQATLKSADSIKRFSYLLGQTDLFRHFCDLKAQRDPEFAAMLAESEKALGKGKGRKGKAANSHRGRKTEKEEDDELLAETKHDDADPDGPFVFTESPAYVKGGQMRDYQVQGLNWMVGLHYNGINGILADEMGLGKTLQTISFLGYLKFHRGIHGPHLVIVPKSTLDNWAREFERWVPGFNVVMLRGGKEERAQVVAESILPQNFDVLITSYELCLREKSALKKLSWEYILIDEAHRIKNVDSMLSQIVRVFDSRARLLITGTPLQNNLHELWALLNFLLPDVFSDVADFDAWFDKQGPAAPEGADGQPAPEQTADQKEAASNSVVKQLHAVLRPFLLRRVKMDVEKSLLPKKEINVYVGMTDLQRKWYKMILEKDIDAVNGAGGKKEGKTRLQNIVMQLRKCCNHPYLFDGAEPGPPFTTDEHLVEASGKMVILDKLLKSMKAKGSRVLIFSQMSRVLDILEDYCMFREYKYCRLDGGTDHDSRMEAIDAYNKPDSEKFIFLLTTRAGGLGINLVSADIVVLYDSDWNPQADLQAMDRAHRIGQTKQVYVFRFVTENAVEEKVLERAAQKLRLDQLVIQQGRTEHKSKSANKDELVDMIQHGAEKIINSSESMEVQADIDDIIKRGEERTAELNSKYAQLNFDDLQIFKSETTTNWEGEDYGGAKKKVGLLWIEPSKRERKSNYSVDGYYRDAMKTNVGRPTGPRGPRQPKVMATNDFQFFPPRLDELNEKEALYLKKKANTVVPLREDPKLSAEELEAERAAQQEAIDNAEPLTEDEEEEKEQLTAEGFATWTKREFQAFIRGSEVHGRDAFDAIQLREIPTKTVDEIKDYASVFWERYTEIDDYERHIKKIEDAEAGRQRNERLSALVKKKVASVSYPLQQIKITYANQTKGKSYTDEEDRFLLCELAKYGVGKEDTPDKIKADINASPLFLFNWFAKSRYVQGQTRHFFSFSTFGTWAPSPPPSLAPFPFPLYLLYRRSLPFLFHIYITPPPFPRYNLSLPYNLALLGSPLLTPVLLLSLSSPAPTFSSF